VKEETNINAEIVRRLTTIRYSAAGNNKETIYFIMRVKKENEFIPNEETDEKSLTKQRKEI
jgi:hypothetical protein